MAWQSRIPLSSRVERVWELSSSICTIRCGTLKDYKNIERLVHYSLYERFTREILRSRSKSWLYRSIYPSIISTQLTSYSIAPTTVPPRPQVCSCDYISVINSSHQSTCHPFHLQYYTRKAPHLRPQNDHDKMQPSRYENQRQGWVSCWKRTRRTKQQMQV